MNNKYTITGRQIHFSIRRIHMKILYFLLPVFALSYGNNVYSQINCEPLDPRQSISEKSEASAKAEADGLFKQLKAGGAIGGSVGKDIQNIGNNVDISERELFRFRALYFLCELYKDDPTISQKEKVSTIKALLQETQDADSSIWDSSINWIYDPQSKCHVFNQYPKTNETITYSGSCKKGVAQGHGDLQYYLDGIAIVRFTGEWKDGKRNGHGVETYKDGERYEGEWKDGKRNGQGVFTYKDGEKRNMKWKDDQFVDFLKDDDSWIILEPNRLLLPIPSKW
jgi:hypothetical protein